MPPKEDNPLLQQMSAQLAELVRNSARDGERLQNVQGAVDAMGEKLEQVTERIWGNGEPGLIEQCHSTAKSLSDCQSRCEERETRRAEVRKELRWWSGRTATAIVAAIATAVATWNLKDVTSPVKLFQQHAAQAAPVHTLPE